MKVFMSILVLLYDYYFLKQLPVQMNVIYVHCINLSRAHNVMFFHSLCHSSMDGILQEIRHHVAAFIKPDQLNVCIEDQLKNHLFVPTVTKFCVMW